MKLILNFRILHLTSSKRFNYFTVKFDRFAGLGFHKGRLIKVVLMVWPHSLLAHCPL